MKLTHETIAAALSLTAWLFEQVTKTQEANNHLLSELSLSLQGPPDLLKSRVSQLIRLA